MTDPSPRWLLLIHQLPPSPAYFRVKTWRQLQALGAVALKNSVYVLPASDEALEDFQWMVRQIEGGGGEASVVQARFVEGLDDGAVEALFRAAREADYRKLLEEAQALRKALPKRPDEVARQEAEAQMARLRKRAAEIHALDFFGAPGRAKLEEALAAMEARLLPQASSASSEVLPMAEMKGRTWVTRKGIHVDRIACAWLIRRFIDPGARLRFVDPKTYRHRRGELRFDMFEGEFTHEGDRCSFETFLHRLPLRMPGLRALAELIHDVDLKDARFKRPETEGFARAIQGVALMHREDGARLQAGGLVLDLFLEAMKGEGP